MGVENPKINQETISSGEYWAIVRQLMSEGQYDEADYFAGHQDHQPIQPSIYNPYQHTQSGE